MNKELESRLIFLDTSAYESKNYQFDDHALRVLCDYLEDGKLHLLITQITIDEIKNHLQSKSEESATTIKRAQREAMFLRNTPELACHGIFEKISKEEIYKIALEKFESFLHRGNTEIISIDNVKASTVFEKYFKSEPPFNGSNKKHEFPDAFVLEALNDISKKRGHQLYIISADSDMEKYARTTSNMIYLKRVDDLLDLVARKEEELKEPIIFSEVIFNKLKDTLLESVKIILSESEYYYTNLSSDFDEQIYQIDIEDINIESKNIISVDDEHVEYEVYFNVSLIAHYSIADYDRSPWDPEDKRYIFVLHTNVVKRHNEVFSANITIDYMDGITTNADIAEIYFTDSPFELSDTNSEVISQMELDINGD